MNPHNNQQHNHNYSDYNDIPIIVILITDSMIMTHITIITSRFTCSSEETLITLTSTIYTLSIHTRILVACTYTIRNNTINYRFLDQKYHSHIGILTIMDHNLHFHYTPIPHRHQARTRAATVLSIIPTSQINTKHQTHLCICIYHYLDLHFYME